MKIKYEFVNGDISEVEVEDSLGALLVDMDRQEYNINHKETSLLSESRKEVADLLGETSEPISIRQKLRQSYEQLDKQHYIKGHDQER